MSKRTVERMVTKINQGMIDLGNHRGGAHFVTKDKDQRIARIETCIKER